ncbi:glycoside hydrolase [Penicillium malachiteum]|uniref:chitinase n=1 Tax=Penicillium malachiteum TaxID=1324776 RepID=A0AAD6N063_9EURO|nr:glycoside hydrolase [Penicillium malachiteum]
MRTKLLTATAVSLLVTLSNARRNIRDKCPTACSSSDTTSWFAYHSTDRLAVCNETMLLDFVIQNPLNDTETQSTIYACAPDSTDTTTSSKRSTSLTNTTDVSLELGTWGSSVSNLDTDLLSIIEDVEAYLGGSANDGSSSTIFGYNGNIAVGLFIGGRLENSNAASTVADEMRSFINQDNAYDQMANQYCGKTSNYIAGMAISTDNDLSAVQELMKSWSLSGCVTGFTSSQTILSSLEVEVDSTNSDSTSLDKRSLPEGSRYGSFLHGSSRHEHSRHHQTLQRRSDCTTVQVVSGDSCTTLVAECGISVDDFYEYNNATDLCSTLAVGQYVCCSAGDLPDLEPQEYSNGTCYTYLVVSGDTCSAIAASYDLTVDNIDTFNNQTWGWLGCDDLQAGENICLSSGDPPFPAAITNAVCGPQVPGTTANGTDSTTGNPGTAASGTNGCISNCGTNITNNADAPDEFYAVGYFEGFNMDRPCLTMEADSIDTSLYTHIIYAFGLIGSNYSISINDSQSDMFDQFLALDDVKRVVSFGGWAFSTDTDTYMIFRDGVTSDNRDTLAQNVADFVSTNGIDGVDFDWEYPGEPDIEGIPAGSDDDGTNYLAFLKALRALLDDDITISTAMPASFWYLQGFPVDDLNNVVDFFIFMTYDLHGQWDYGNEYSDDGCTAGNCLRSDVNLTETGYALSMVTKAGAEANKLMVGVTSYGRSFEMTTANCTGPDCTYTGPDSGATPGRCTQTAGYIANAEINEIIANNPTVQVLFDDASDSDIIVYNDTQWVGYMTTTTKSTRTTYYQGLNMGGTTEWAIDLEAFAFDPDSLSLTGLDVDLSDAEQCVFPDSSTTSSATASTQRNVANYINTLLTTLKDEGHSFQGWDKVLFGDNTTECSVLSENVNCELPSSSTCSNYSEPSLYWARYVVANYRLYVAEYYDVFNTANTNVTGQIEQLVSDFPMKVPDTVPDYASILTNFGGALGIVSGFLSDELTSTLVATVGGIASEAGGDVSSDTDDDTSALALYKRASAVFTDFFDSTTSSLDTMFDAGDISSWDSSLTTGDWDFEIANFFDGRYMYELDGTDDVDIETQLNGALLATLAGTALVSANYYILKGAHTTDDCDSVTSGTVIDGWCYTLEYPGSTGYSLLGESDFSDAIASDDLTKLTDTYNVTLTQLYSNSYICQNNTGGYGGTMDIDVVFNALTTLPQCFYNLPVFTVDSDGGATSSPCLVLSYNETDSTAVLGVSHMPSNLADIFVDSFCFCEGSSSNRACDL